MALKKHRHRATFIAKRRGALFALSLAFAASAGCLAQPEDLEGDDGDFSAEGESLGRREQGLSPPGQCAANPLAVGVPASSSSNENASFLPALAVDGNSSTRWSSARTDPQWLRLDLGAPRYIDRVVLDWETASAADYKVELSADGNSWSSAAAVTGAATGARSDVLSSLSSRVGRYLRVTGTRRTTQWGYSLYEARVYGDANANCASSARDITKNLEAEDHDGMSGLQYESTSDVGGGQNAGWIDSGDALEWKIVAPSSGNYTITTRSATWTNAGIAVVVDGVQATIMTLPSTWQGSGAQYQTWGSFTSNPFELSAGNHTVRVIFTSSGQNLNWAKLSPVAVNPELTVGLWRLMSKSDLSTMTWNGASFAGASYGATANQQWRLKSPSAGRYTLALESTPQCLTVSGNSVSLGTCSTASTILTLDTLRVATEDRPALYRLRTQANTCLVPGGASGPSVGACDDAAQVYIEPVGWGERNGSLEYDTKALLIVKPETHVAAPVSNGIMDPEIVAGAQTSYVDRVSAWISRITDGRVKWDAEAVVSPDPLSSYSFEGGNYLPAAMNVPEDVNRYVPMGKYDTAAVFFIEGNVPGGWGWGPGSSPASNYTLWVTVNGGTTPAEQWTSWNTEPSEVFIHEPMHGYDGFFSQFNVALPDGWLHGAEDNHYARSELYGWLPWYRDYWLGRVIAADDTYRGYGPRAFRLPKPREDALKHR